MLEYNAQIGRNRCNGVPPRNSQGQKPMGVDTGLRTSSLTRRHKVSRKCVTDVALKYEVGRQQTGFNTQWLCVRFSLIVMTSMKTLYFHQRLWVVTLVLLFGLLIQLYVIVLFSNRFKVAVPDSITVLAYLSKFSKEFCINRY